MFVCYNYADNFLNPCINPSKILFYYKGTFNVFRGPIWFQNCTGKSLISGERERKANARKYSVIQTNVGCTLGDAPMSAV